MLWRHVLPNALIPVVTVIGYNFGYSLTGAILVETVFAWPGLGSLFITSIGNRDYPVLQGIFLLTAIAVVIANVVTDLIYACLDPRVAHDRASPCIGCGGASSRHRAGVLAAAYVLVLVLGGARNALPAGPRSACRSRMRSCAPPSPHILGTDELGRDVLAGIVHGVAGLAHGRLRGGARRDRHRHHDRRDRGLLRRALRSPRDAHRGNLPGGAELHPRGRDRRARPAPALRASSA